jgi:hypothetical protein
MPVQGRFAAGAPGVTVLAVLLPLGCACSLSLFRLFGSLPDPFLPFVLSVQPPLGFSVDLPFQAAHDRFTGLSLGATGQATEPGLAHLDTEGPLEVP